MPPNPRRIRHRRNADPVPRRKQHTRTDHPRGSASPCLPPGSARSQHSLGRYMPEHTFHPIDLILKKREGTELSTEEIQFFVRSVVRNGEQKLARSPNASAHSESLGDAITDAQIGSFLMAVYQRGLSHRELADLTTAMRFSGETFDASSLNTFTVDKHSTGGVGDKSSLLIAPILAAAGLEGSPSVSVPMISGRSLGHTGGTLDKLESIPGFRTEIPLDRME